MKRFQPELVGLAEEDGVAVVALGRKAFGVDTEDLFSGFRRRQPVARLQVDAPPELVARLAEGRRRVEQLVEGLLDHLDDRRPGFVPRGVAAIVQLRQQFDGRDDGFGSIGGRYDRAAEPAELPGRPGGDLHDVGEQAVSVTPAQPLVDFLCTEGLDRTGGARRVEHRFLRQVATHAAPFHLDLAAELVGAGKHHAAAVAVGARRHREDEGSTVAGRTPAGVPVAVGHRREALVLRRQTAKRGVDGLLLRADEADLDVAGVRQREHLRAQHRGVGDTHELQPVVLVAGDDEEPRAIGRRVDVRGRDLPVDALLLGRELVEVVLGGRRQRLDDVLERVLVDPVPQIEQLDRDLGVGEELLADVPLLQVLGDRVVVGEVAVVHQRLVQAHERVRPARMPHAALGGISLVSYPHVGVEVLQLVVLHVLLGVTHALEDQEVAGVREHEGALLAQRRVVLVVELVGVAPYELVFQRPRLQVLKAGRLSEFAQHLGLDPHGVPVHVRRAHFQADLPVVLDVRLAHRAGHVEMRQYVVALELRMALGIEQSDLQQVVGLQLFLGDAQLLGHQPRSRDAAALAVAPVLHLLGGLVDELALHGNRAGKARDSATAFLDGFVGDGSVGVDPGSSGKDLLGQIGVGDAPAIHRAAPVAASAGAQSIPVPASPSLM